MKKFLFIVLLASGVLGENKLANPLNMLGNTIKNVGLASNSMDAVGLQQVDNIVAERITNFPFIAGVALSNYVALTITNYVDPSVAGMSNFVLQTSNNLERVIISSTNALDVKFTGVTNAINVKFDGATNATVIRIDGATNAVVVRFDNATNTLVAKAGSTMTGTLKGPSVETITGTFQNAWISRMTVTNLDVISMTATGVVVITTNVSIQGTVNMNGYAITNMADPVLPKSAVTLQYLQSVSNVLWTNTLNSIGGATNVIWTNTLNAIGGATNLLHIELDSATNVVVTRLDGATNALNVSLNSATNNCWQTNQFLLMPSAQGYLGSYDVTGTNVYYTQCLTNITCVIFTNLITQGAGTLNGTQGVYWTRPNGTSYWFLLP